MIEPLSREGEKPGKDSKKMAAAQQQQSLEQALEKFIDSNEFGEAITDATKASWGGSGYSIELFEDGSFRVLWNNEIGNLYESPGVILGLPTWDDSDMQECLDAGMSEEDYWYECYSNEKDEIANELREKLA